LKAELGRIPDKEEIVKDMKECWNINKPKVLSALKKSKMKEVHDILELMKDCATEDEKGELLYYFNQPN
jgi:hypothetical protein